MFIEVGHVSPTSMSDKNCHLSPTPFRFLFQLVLME